MSTAWEWPRRYRGESDLHHNFRALVSAYAHLYGRFGRPVVRFYTNAYLLPGSPAFNQLRDLREESAREVRQPASPLHLQLSGRVRDSRPARGARG